MNDFYQIYSNNILIYNYIKRKYIRHVHLILTKFREINLQIIIKMCEFDIEKIVFLNIIVSKFDFRINSEKMKIIVN